MNRIIKSLIKATVACTVLAGAHSAMADSYPTRPIKLIIPYQPGQGTDIAGRYLADQLSKALGQNVIPDNKPGAAGNIGTAAAAKAPADGYTLVMGTAGTFATSGHLYHNPGFDSVKDFEPIALLGAIPMAISVHPDSGIRDVQDLIAKAKAKPDSINVAMPSTSARLVYEMLKGAGAPLFGVPYKGSGTAMPEVIGGQVPVIIDTVIATRPQVGKIKPIAITIAKESKLLPGVKSVAEQGIKGFEYAAWAGVYAPRGMPRDIYQRLVAETRKIVSRPEFSEKLMQLGLEPYGPKTVEEMVAFTRDEYAKAGELIKVAGLPKQ